MAASTVTPPVATFDTGRMAVPTSLTVVDAAINDMIGAHFANPTAAPITVTVTNTAGLALVPTTEVPPTMPILFEFGMMPTTGLKWQASGAGLIGQLWGYAR